MIALLQREVEVLSPQQAKCLDSEAFTRFSILIPGAVKGETINLVAAALNINDNNDRDPIHGKLSVDIRGRYDIYLDSGLIFAENTASGSLQRNGLSWNGRLPMPQVGGTASIVAIAINDTGVDVDLRIGGTIERVIHG